MVAGHATFGDSCHSNLLRNYASDDMLAVGGLIATGISIVAGYPLAFAGLMDSLRGAAASLLGSYPKTMAPLAIMSNPKYEDMIRMGLLAVATFVAYACDDIGLVVGLTGSLVGATIVYIAPAAITLRANRMVPIIGSFQTVVCYGLILLGLVLGSIGAAETIKAYI